MDVLPLRTGDRTPWEHLFRLYFASFGRELAAEVPDATWDRILDPSVPIHGHAAWKGGEMVGMALSVIHLATRGIAPHYYLSDLFVLESARRQGVAGELIAFLFDHARTLECDRIYWMTEETNAPARQLYDRLAVRSGFIEYRCKLA